MNDQVDLDTHLAEPIHPSVITYPHRALFLEVAGSWRTVRIVHDDRGLTTLNDVYWYGVRAAKGEDLGLSTPYAGVADVRAVACKLPRADGPSVPRTSAIFALHAGKEGHKVLRVR